MHSFKICQILIVLYMVAAWLQHGRPSRDGSPHVIELKIIQRVINMSSYYIKMNRDDLFLFSWDLVVQSITQDAHGAMNKFSHLAGVWIWKLIRHTRTRIWHVSSRRSDSNARTIRRHRLSKMLYINVKKSLLLNWRH